LTALFSAPFLQASGLVVFVKSPLLTMIFPLSASTTGPSVDKPQGGFGGGQQGGAC